MGELSLSGEAAALGDEEDGDGETSDSAESREPVASGADGEGVREVPEALAAPEESAEEDAGGVGDTEDDGEVEEEEDDEEPEPEPDGEPESEREPDSDSGFEPRPSPEPEPDSEAEVEPEAEPSTTPVSTLAEPVSLPRPDSSAQASQAPAP